MKQGVVIFQQYIGALGHADENVFNDLNKQVDDWIQRNTDATVVSAQTTQVGHFAVCTILYKV